MGGLCFGCCAKVSPNNFGSKTKALAVAKKETKDQRKQENEANGKWKFVFLSHQSKKKNTRGKQIE